MDDSTRKLKGSENLDLFKYLHKNKLPKGFYAFDVDLCLVQKDDKRIVAFLDLKVGQDQATFSEILGYVRLIELAPLFFLYVDNTAGVEKGCFYITQFTGGDYKPYPPVLNQIPIHQCIDWSAYNNWENLLRNGILLRTL